MIVSVHLLVSFLLFLHTNGAYNYLCDNTRWHVMTGTWNFNTTDCSLEVAESAGNRVLWFGDNTGLIPDSYFNSLESFTVKLLLTINNDCVGHTALFFRAKSVSTASQDGQQYMYAIKPQNNKLYVVQFDNQTGWNQHAIADYSSQMNQTYELKLVASNDPYENRYIFYVNNNLILNNIELTDYLFGSFGLRASNCPTKYHSLIVQNGTTSDPTNSPTMLPTIKPSLFPSINPTYMPSLFPSIEPSNIPSSEPSIRPSSQPTDTPTVKPSDEPTIVSTLTTMGNVNQFSEPTSMTVSVDSENSNKDSSNGDSGDSLGAFEIVMIVIAVCICLLVACLTVAAFVCIYDRRRQHAELSIFCVYIFNYFMFIFNLFLTVFGFCYPFCCFYLFFFWFFCDIETPKSKTNTTHYTFALCASCLLVYLSNGLMIMISLAVIVMSDHSHAHAKDSQKQKIW